MNTWWVALLVAATGPPLRASKDASREFVLSTGAVERVALPSSLRGASVEVTPLLRTVTIRTGRARSLHAQLRNRGMPALCPDAVVIGRDRLELRCLSGALEAKVVAGKRGTFLELRRLRGLPTHDASLAWTSAESWPPQVLHLRQGPQWQRVERAEHALRTGRRQEADRLYRELLDGPARALASVRLGDLSASRGETAVAIDWYERARGIDSVGRMAGARVCELRGDCLDETVAMAAIFDAKGLPEPLRSELELRQIRAEAIGGDALNAATLLLRRIERLGPSACSARKPMCSHIALLAFRAGGDVEIPLALFAALPSGDVAAVRRELGTLASKAADSLGAHGAAAAMLAEVTTLTPRSERGAHLLRLAALYQRAGDHARLAEVLHFARSQLPAREMRGSDWREFQRWLDDKSAVQASGGTSAWTDVELARAAAFAARSRTASPH